MHFKKFLESIVESKQLNESSDIKIKFHKKHDDLFGDANTILVDDSKFDRQIVNGAGEAADEVAALPGIYKILL